MLLHVGMFLGILPCMFSPGLVLPDTLEDSPTYVCSTTMFCTTNPVVSALLWHDLVLSGFVWSCLVCLCVCLSVRVSPSVGLGGYTRRQRSTCLLLRVRELPHGGGGRGVGGSGWVNEWCGGQRVWRIEGSWGGGWCWRQAAIAACRGWGDGRWGGVSETDEGRRFSEACGCCRWRRVAWGARAGGGRGQVRPGVG